jgi:acetylornithine/succinyldiaminopimelate/putrescine aminotransferase
VEQMATTSDSRILAKLQGTDAPAVARARGVWITDTEGRTYLDGCSDAVVSNIGQFGCDSAQGYFLSKPLSEEALTSWMRNRSSKGLLRRGTSLS